MTDRTAQAAAPPDDWPARSDPVLALHGMGSFDWDLASGRMHLDATAQRVLDLRPGDFEGVADQLGSILPSEEAARVDDVITGALRSGADHYGTYFRLRCRDGSLRWAHTQGYIRRTPDGHPRRILGVVREATEELSDQITSRIAQGADAPADGPPDDTAGDEEADERAERERAVVERTTDALARARTVQDVVDAFGERSPDGGVPNFGAAGLALGLVEARSIRVHTQTMPSGGVRVPWGTVPFDAADPMAEVVRTLRPRFLDSPEEFEQLFPELWPYFRGSGVTAAAFVPLIVQARPLGVLALVYRGRTGGRGEERRVLLALSSAVAQSLQRAVFFEQDQELATDLQQALLPRSIPDVPGAEIAVRYRAAALGRDIGGDWYDVIPLSGGRVGVVIGDVQGHDSHAAAVMGHMRTVLHVYASEGHTPATVLARASVFLSELGTERFATCVYVEADPATGVVQIVRAGHLNPLLARADGRCVAMPVEGGLPLGLSAEFGRLAYPVTAFELDPGQTLVLCTDGLVEQPGHDLDDGIDRIVDRVEHGPAGLEDLADVLTGEDVPAGQAGGTTGGRGVSLPGFDDMALLLLRRSPSRAPGPGRRLRRYVTPGDPEALAAARRMIRTAVDTYGAPDRAEEVELVADELITNTLVHTESPAVVTLRMPQRAGQPMRVEVADTSSALPHRRATRRSAELTAPAGTAALAAPAGTADLLGAGRDAGTAYTGIPGGGAGATEGVEGAGTDPETAVSGRGLTLVEALADGWGVYPLGGGKCVWGEFTVPPRT